MTCLHAPYPEGVQALMHRQRELVRAKATPLTMLTAWTKLSGVIASSSAASAGVVDHTMLLNPSLTGSRAKGPLGRKTCSAMVLGVSVVTVATRPRCL